MKKQRMTADNVEQLMDIVRALQQGEEPDPQKRKQAREAEEKDSQDAFEQSLEEDHTEEEFQRGKKAVSDAAAKASGFLDGLKEKQKQHREEQARLRRQRRQEQEKQRKAEEAEAAEREKLQEAEKAEAVGEEKLQEAGKAKAVGEEKLQEAGKAKAVGQEKLQEAEKAKAVRQEKQQETEETEAAERKKQRKAKTTGREKQRTTEEVATVEQKSWQRSDAEEKNTLDEERRQLRRRLTHMERVLRHGLEEDDDLKTVASKKVSEPKSSDSMSDVQPERESEMPAGKQLNWEDEVPAGERSDREDEAPAGGQSNREDEMMIGEQPDQEGEMPLGEQPEPVSGAPTDQQPDLKEQAQSSTKSELDDEKLSSSEGKKKSERRPRKKNSAKDAFGAPTPKERVADVFYDFKSRILDALEQLGQKGIRSKEMIMLGAAALFILLLILLAVSAVRGNLEQKEKSKHVTADEGLTVLVEEEPSAWCSSYPVRLKVYARKESITSISVNGEICAPDEENIITVNAQDWILNVEAVTASGTKKARVELEYLDSDAPVLEIEKEENQIILTAVDARSSVADVYYAATAEKDYLQLPVYQKYTGAILYEEGTVYRFYSKDKAGNCSAPVVSTLEKAESFSLSQTTAALFPGETLGLGVTAEPEGALLENLNFESMDPEILSVEQNGKVTAVGEGTAAIRVSAAGMDSQVCTVTVSQERTVTISTIGDCTLGSDASFNTSTSFDAFDAVNGHDYFFQNVRDILSQDDVTFANLEGTLTDATTRQNKQYAFKGDPSYTEVLTSGSVEVVTLANNHSSDYGEESLTDTKLALEEADIDYCMGDEIALREVNGVKTAFIGIYVLDKGMERESQVQETIARAKKQGAKLVIVAFHWGSEKQNYPDSTQTSLAHTAIDSGADLVVGHHPHVLQGIEKYNGKYIVYSLANFCFGGNSAPSDTDTIIFRQKFTVSASGAVDSGDIEIIPCKISSASGYNNYQPTPATGADAETIIGRLNEYSAEYGQTYTAAELS